jgi:hypothetical protein
VPLLGGKIERAVHDALVRAVRIEERGVPIRAPAPVGQQPAIDDGRPVGAERLEHLGMVSLFEGRTRGWMQRVLARPSVIDTWMTPASRS